MAKKNQEFTNKVAQFCAALLDCYKDEEARESEAFPKIELGSELTDDLTAMLMAMSIICDKLTGDEQDIIGYTHLLNRLAIQHVMEYRESEED